MQLNGMPYVAGTVRGVLQRRLSKDPSRCILLVGQTELRPFTRLPAGFVIIDGAPFSHAMIPLVGAGIPAIIISSTQVAELSIGSEVCLDGTTGSITTDDGCVQGPVVPVSRSAGITTDGVAIQLRVSIRDAPAAKKAADSAADAIGLVRTEYLVPDDGRMPDLDYYRHEFQAICMAAAPLPVTFRLLDIAVDKFPDWLSIPTGIGGTLGLQGVRLFAYEPVRSVYQAQLAAIEELSRDCAIRVLIPYLSSQEELVELTREIRHELSRPIPLGAMIETPAAALQINDWLQLVDFAAVGCNDLMQCLFGADRDRFELRHYLNPYAPALYRFLSQLAEAASAHLHQLQLCGLLSQLPGILPILLGLGFRLYSVEAASLDYLRLTIARTSITEARRLAKAVCLAQDASQVRKLLSDYNAC